MSWHKIQYFAIKSVSHPDHRNEVAQKFMCRHLVLWKVLTIVSTINAAISNGNLRAAADAELLPAGSSVTKSHLEKPASRGYASQRGRSERQNSRSPLALDQESLGPGPNRIG